MADFAVLTPADDMDGCSRPYHHGDLQRALVGAARRILEREDASALSLRGVAREAGVSPAAPYHHFKDKSELLMAVAEEAFGELGAAMRAAMDEEPHDTLTAMGVAYVVFARANPGLYRVMYDAMCLKSALPEDHEAKPDSAYMLVRDALVEAGAAAPDDELGIEIATGALWCAVHGLAEMAGFAHFQPLIAAVGGEREFYRRALAHVGHLKMR